MLHGRYVRFYANYILSTSLMYVHVEAPDPEFKIVSKFL